MESPEAVAIKSPLSLEETSQILEVCPSNECCSFPSNDQSFKVLSLEPEAIIEPVLPTHATHFTFALCPTKVRFNLLGNLMPV